MLHANSRESLKKHTNWIENHWFLVQQILVNNGKKILKNDYYFTSIFITLFLFFHPFSQRVPYMLNTEYNTFKTIYLFLLKKTRIVCIVFAKYSLIIWCVYLYFNKRKIRFLYQTNCTKLFSCSCVTRTAVWVLRTSYLNHTLIVTIYIYNIRIDAGCEFYSVTTRNNN